MAAAMTAAELGIPVRLRETAARPFAVQANCPSRWLHPHQYDWPLAWYSDPEFPRPEEDYLPLHWRADYSASVAAQWQTQYDDFLQRGYDFQAWYNSPPLPETSPEQLEAACDRDLATGNRFYFGAYLLCRGFPSEKVSIGKYSGFKFWANDPFTNFASLAKYCVRKKVLISGAGDGGLQDLLRFAFARTHPIELVGNVIKVLNRTQNGLEALATCCSEIIESVLAPRIVGGSDPCRTFVESLNEGVLSDVFDQFEEIVTFDFGSNRLQLICASIQFPSNFALNRLLVRFLEKFVSVRYPQHPPLVSFGVSIKRVRGVLKHMCANRANDCYGQLHRCEIGGKTTTFDLLVVRHGFGREKRKLEKATGRRTKPPKRAS